MSPLHAIAVSSSSSPFVHLSNPFRRSDPLSLSLPSKLRPPLPSPFHAKKPLRSAAAATNASSSSLDYLDDSDPPLPPAVRTFWRWMAEEGVISSTCPLRPAYVAEGLGLVARRDIAEDEIILKVPRRLWVNPDIVSSSEIGYLCTELKPWVQVALFLIREKLRPNSWWRFYVDILPETTNSTIFWSEEELAELKGTQLLTMTVEMKEHVKSQFLKVEEEIIIPNRELFPSTITLDGFYWAFGMIRSRAFSRLSGQLAMLPLVDFINHSSLITREDNAEEMDGPAGLFSWDLLFCLKSTIPVKEGEQAYIQYGLKKSSADMALYYGFVEPNTARDAYTFTFTISDSDPYFKDKLEIAKAKELEETAYFDVFIDRDLPPSMLPYLRLAALKDSDAFLLEPNFRHSVWDILALQVSRANEEIVCKMVIDACKSALSGYATTIEEDERLLGGNQLDPRFEMAVRVRAGEKRVLQQIEGKFKKTEEKLGELEYYHDRRLKELALVGDQGEIYCQPSKEHSISIPSPVNSK